MNLLERSASLPDVLPYGSFIADGACEMRGLGVMVGLKMIGPSPESDSPDDVAATRDQLSRAMVHLTAGGVPHQDFFYTSPAGARQAQLELGPVAKAIVAATGSTDVQRARQIWTEHPSAEAFTEAWLRERVPGWQPSL
jgi:hypothetical protein